LDLDRRIDRDRLSDCDKLIVTVFDNLADVEDERDTDIERLAVWVNVSDNDPLTDGDALLACLVSVGESDMVSLV